MQHRRPTLPRASYLATVVAVSLASVAAVAAVAAQQAISPTGSASKDAARGDSPATLVRASVAPSLVRAPGGAEAIAVAITVAPQWHIYWSNPGDSGAAPSVKIELPPGWSSGALTFPRPEIFGDSEDRTYGYSGTVHLLVPVKRPAGWQGTVHVRGELSWLACKRSCVSGRTALDGQVATDASSMPDPPASRAWPLAMPAGSSASIVGEGGSRTLVVSMANLAESATVQFIPDDCAGIAWGAGTGPIELSWDGAKRLWTLRTPITVTPGDAPGGAPRVRGLILAGADPAGPAHFVDIPASGTPTLQRPESTR
jgi:thiol:disulfide interchange protein DsbD